jgi:cell division inhibitor SepF
MKYFKEDPNMAFGDFLHKVASIIGLETNDRRSFDDYDDEPEYDEYDDDEPVRGSARSASRFSPGGASRSKQPTSRTTGTGRTSGTDDAQYRRASPGSGRVRDPYNNVVQMPLGDRAPTPQSSAGYTPSASHHSAMIVYVNRRDDAEQLINYVLEGRSVILSCERIDDATCQRVIDMLAGAAYAVEGHVEKISKGNYVFAPASVDIYSDAKTQPKFGAVGR